MVNNLAYRSSIPYYFAWATDRLGSCNSRGPEGPHLCAQFSRDVNSDSSFDPGDLRQRRWSVISRNLEMRLAFMLAWSMAVVASSLKPLWAQDLSPRAYVITPVHSNAVILTYSFFSGSVL